MAIILFEIYILDMFNSLNDCKTILSDTTSITSCNGDITLVTPGGAPLISNNPVSLLIITNC